MGCTFSPRKKEIAPQSSFNDDSHEWDFYFPYIVSLYDFIRLFNFCQSEGLYSLPLYQWYLIVLIWMSFLFFGLGKFS